MTVAITPVTGRIEVAGLRCGSRPVLRRMTVRQPRLPYCFPVHVHRPGVNLRYLGVSPPVTV